LIEAADADTVDEEAYWSLEARLHDFGFRGCTSIEQSVIGGAAHLLNFTGGDTMSAAYYVQFHLNNGKPVGNAIPATEHSVMTAWKTEKEAIRRMISRFGIMVFACVMDSYDYTHALEKVLPSIAAEKVEAGGFMVIRPDSGDQVETILMGLRAAEKVFGSDMNKKGYKVIRGAGVIQGDGVSLTSLASILAAVKEAGFSAQNVAFGMGGGLLQKVNRDTLSFATKLSHITYDDGEARDLMKTPKTDGGKQSLPGEFAVCRDASGIPIVYPKTDGADKANLLRVVYDHGKVTQWDDFDTVRARVAETWSALPKNADNISQALKDKVRIVLQKQKEILQLQYAST
jgi:nicotinamide phosphoribosyltransferase